MCTVALDFGAIYKFISLSEYHKRYLKKDTGIKMSGTEYVEYIPCYFRKKTMSQFLRLSVEIAQNVHSMYSIPDCLMPELPHHAELFFYDTPAMKYILKLLQNTT